MLASKILDTVTDLYHDKDFDRIDETTYLNYITDALNLLLLVRPDANSVGVTYETTAGLEQTLPDDGFRLIDIAYNISALGVPSTPITRVDRTILDNACPTWMQDTDTSCSEFIYDPTIPKEFILYPQVPAGTKVRLYYSQAFPAVTSSTQEIDLDDIFFNPVVDAVMTFLYRMDMESSEFTTDKASFHAQMFTSSLQTEQGAGLGISPAGGK